MLIRWVLLRDPTGRFAPQALLSTDRNLAAEQIVSAFVRRWSMENLPGGPRLLRPGRPAPVERSGRCPLHARALGPLLGGDAGRCPLVHNCAGAPSAWHAKTHPTFADALAHTRRLLWRQMGLPLSASADETRKPTTAIFVHLTELLCYAA